MKKILLILLTLGLILGASSAVFAGWDPDDTDDKSSPAITSMEKKAKETVAKFIEMDSDLLKFVDRAYGYAVFPTVGKGAIGIGGAYGKGLVYEKGTPIGRTTLKQVSYGLQLGGQSYSEIIFFKDKEALNIFLQGNFEFGAGASAVAITVGASADTDYSDGVAVFTMTKAGLMYEASISGQKFSYKPFK